MTFTVRSCNFLQCIKDFQQVVRVTNSALQQLKVRIREVVLEDLKAVMVPPSPIELVEMAKTIGLIVCHQLEDKFITACR